MPTSDLDLPLLPSADQIRRREFATVRRGYDPDQVRDYLFQVADQVQILERDVREVRMSSDSRAASTEPSAPPAAAEDPYEQLALRLAGVIRSADSEAQKIVDEAKVECARMLEQARTEADRIRVDAQARAEEARQQGTEALEEARREAETILGGLASRRENLVAQMQEMQSRLLSVAEGLEVAADDQDEVTDDGPVHMEPEPQARTPEPEPQTRTSEHRPTQPTLAVDAGEDPVDPRYEDLWISDDQIDIPDLASIDLDLDEDSRGTD